jgi:hypothetical protein
VTIPVLITALVNRPDLLDRLADSIDHPVDRKLVVDNGHTGWSRDGWHVMAPPFLGLGWPGALNFGIEQTPDAPYWIGVNNDAYFEPGVLAELAERICAATGPLVLHHEWTVFAMNRAVVDIVGLFDTACFYPVYYDDTDFSYRCHLAGVPVIDDRVWALEGDIGQTNVASLTIRSDERLSRENDRTWNINHNAYVNKWGGPPGHETYSSPWDTGLPLWVTKPDLAGRAARSWR